MQQMQTWLQKLERYTDRWWYPPVLGLMAAIDLFTIVIPTDGLLVSSVMISPKRWVFMGLATALGSSIGAWALAAVLEVHGLPFLQQFLPDITQSSAWIWTDHLMQDWGSLTLFIVAISPIMQHPAVAMAAFAQMPLWEIFGFVFAGRALKYLFLAWVASHSPKLLNKLWGIQNEIKEMGVNTQKIDSKQK